VRRAVPAAAVVAVVAVVAVALAACSGSSEDSARPLTTVSVSVSVSEATTSTAPPEVTTTVAAPAAGPERCPGSAVRIAFLDSRAAAGHSLAVFEVRSTASRPCRLTGHPAVEVLEPSGRVLATAAPGAGSILDASPPAAVTVGPRGAAYFGVESETVCPDDAPGTDADRLRVVLPEDTAPVEVAAAITVCPRPGILVSPLRASQDELTGG
jgi:uncharacterized protein DUF4232